MQVEFAYWIAVPQSEEVTEPYPGLRMYRRRGYAAYPVGEAVPFCIGGRPVAVVRVESVSWNAAGGGETVVQFTELRQLSADEAAALTAAIRPR